MSGVRDERWKIAEKRRIAGRRDRALRELDEDAACRFQTKVERDRCQFDVNMLLGILVLAIARMSEFYARISV